MCSLSPPLVCSSVRVGATVSVQHLSSVPSFLTFSTQGAHKKRRREYSRMKENIFPMIIHVRARWCNLITMASASHSCLSYRNYLCNRMTGIFFFKSQIRNLLKQKKFLDRNQQIPTHYLLDI